jgi:signal transduction histidine kinase/ligand-binding sensor domain-containing protein/DNA-binding response OmpR family regulator
MFFHCTRFKGKLITASLSIIFLLISSPPLFALDPHKRITQYDVRIYKAGDGLPMNDLKDVFQDSNGYLWLACQEGLARFDGARFVLFDKSNLAGLRENFIWDIAEDWEGKLWFGAQGGGASRYDGTTISTFDTSDGLISNVVTDIVIGTNRAIWFGTEHGVTRLQNGAFSSYRLGDESKRQAVSAMHEDANGNLLIGTAQRALHVLRRDSIFTLAMDGAASSFCKKSSGEIIIGTTDGALFVYRNDRVERYHPDRLPTRHAIRGIHEDKDGNLWFSVDGNGIVRYYGGRFEVLNIESGLPVENDFFHKVIEDREGNLWFAGDAGLCKLSDNKFIVFGRKEGLPSNFGHTVCEDHAGNIWAGLRDGGLVKINRHSVRRFGTADGLKSSVVTSLFPAHDGGLWIGSDGGLNYLKDDHIRKLGNEANIHAGIRSLFENARGELWIGTLSGLLFKISDNKISSYKLAPEGESGDVIAVIETATGEVWAGTRKKGLYELSEGKIRRFTVDDGIAADGVNALYEDDQQAIWIATDGQGLYRFKDGSFVNISTKDGLYFDRLFSILEDDRHNLWFSGNRGIFCASKKVLNDFADGKQVKIARDVYDALDGMRETECNGRRQPVAWKSRDGKLWFASIAGIVCADPNNMPMNTVAPQVYLEEVITDQRRIDASPMPTLRLQAKERELEFRFTALSFTIPERVCFKYKLEDHDNDWIDAGTRRSAFYTNLPKGDYTFRVTACNNDGVWNETGAALQFNIAPYWWETWWAHILFAAAFVLIVLFFRRRELKRVHLRNELALQQVQNERLEELDNLKSRFFAGISHEFRTPLTLIAGPLQEIEARIKDKREKANVAMMLRHTRRLERLVDQLLDLSQLQSGKLKLEARPVRLSQFLLTLVAAFESYAYRKKISLTFECSDRLENKMLYLDADKMEKVIANFLSNAIKYTGSGGTVKVSVKKCAAFSSNNSDAHHQDEYVAIHVRDSGAGIPEQAQPYLFDYFYRYRDEKTRRESGAGIGLALAKELVELHHGKISFTTETGIGSEFIVSLPCGKAHLKPEDIASDDAGEGHLDFFDPGRSGYVEEPAPESHITRARKPPSERSARHKVLLVEDNTDMRGYLIEHLNRDAHVIEALDGADGLQKAVQEIPDLIISDVMMPGMDGFELCRKLKAAELTSHIPIILLTARGSGESKMEGLSLGADEYLTKPVNGQELRLRARNVLQRQQKMRERLRKEIIANDLHHVNDSLASADEKFLHKVSQVLEQHLSDPDFGPEALAREIAISRTHLNRKLLGLLGQHTSEFIRAIRLKRAAELLEHKSGTISEIAYQAGFNHLSYFSRCFKKQYGRLPSEYLAS